MSEENVAVVKRMHEAFDRQDIPALLEEVHSDVEWKVSDSLPYGGSFSGPDGVGAFFAQIPEHFEELQVVVDEVIDADDRVVELVRLQGRGKGGAEVAAAAAFIWELQDGKAIAFEEHVDTAAVLAGLATNG
jgi:ketosteroid isomerase-like protein